MCFKARVNRSRYYRSGYYYVNFTNAMTISYR